MLDFSASALHRLAQEHLDWGNIDTVWVSHFHLDHCCGLPAYLFAIRHAPETRDRIKPLSIFGGKGMNDLLVDFNRVANGKLLEQKFPVNVVEIESLEKFRFLPEVDAIALSTDHTKESNAIRIEDAEGKVLVYTSDTGFNKTLSEFARNADLLIIESSFVKNKTTPIHLELSEAMFLIQRAKPKRALLTHFYAEWDLVDFNDEVRRFSPTCKVLEAVDGLRVTI
jgi:ribonuclease BN (tRNA processing enzyme)